MHQRKNWKRKEEENGVKESCFTKTIHISKLTTQKLENLGFQIIDHPPYSLDLAPSDFFLFPQLKKFLKGTKFESNTDIIETVNGWIEDQSSEFFLAGIKKLESRCQKCIELKGEYVE